MHRNQVQRYRYRNGVEGVENMSQEEYRKAAVDAVKKLSADVGIQLT